MSFHKVIIFMITIVGVFIQLEFQSTSSSLLETHYWIMSAFFVALLAFAMTWLKSTTQVQADENANHTGAMREISLMSGILAIALLFLIVHTVIGCAILLFLALYVIKRFYSYKPVNDVLFPYLDELKRALCGQLDEEINEETPSQEVGDQ